MPRTGTVLISMRHLWVCLSLPCCMEFASKLFASQTNSAIMVWLVGFGCVEMGSDWLAQAGTHCVAQAIRGFLVSFI